jgi:secondary thiamine-phosphate synthase enzyme
MRQASGSLNVRAPSRGLHEITREIAGWTTEAEISEGLLTVFCSHTSASLVIQENATPAAKRDLERYFERIAPEGADYEHDDEGPDDMPSHLRSAMTRTSEAIPISEGRLALGTWQAVYLFEHRRHAHTRHVVVHVCGLG